MAAAEVKMTWLIVGADGQLGRSLQEALKIKNITYQPLTHRELDITDLPKTKEILKNSSADVIVNAAAYTNVDQAELESEKAFSVNEKGAHNLAIAARGQNSKLIHLSTDYVFSGPKKHPWKITDEVRPLSIYGKSKLAGEIAVMNEYSECSIIIRTAWLYSPFGNNFYKTILRLALSDSNPIHVVNDQFGQPTNAEDLASLIISAINNNVPSGIYHGSNSGVATWHDFAVEIFKLAGADTKRVNTVSAKDYKSRASRPEYSVLDNSRWSEFDVEVLAPWQESVRRAFPAIYESLGQ